MSAASRSTSNVDLATVAEDVLDTARLGDRQVHATLEPTVISGDPVLAERLISNLVDNAVRYNAAGGDIWIGTRTAAGNSQLIVANTGPAISPADAERIFQPFQRLDDRTSDDGFGLGLAIVASIAAVHGGAVTARPRDDGGLSVTVTIPSAITLAPEDLGSEDQLPALDRKAPEAGGTGQAAQPRGRGKTSTKACEAVAAPMHNKPDGLTDPPHTT